MLTFDEDKSLKAAAQKHHNKKEVTFFNQLNNRRLIHFASIWLLSWSHYVSFFDKTHLKSERMSTLLAAVQNIKSSAGRMSFLCFNCFHFCMQFSSFRVQKSEILVNQASNVNYMRTIRLKQTENGHWHSFRVNRMDPKPKHHHTPKIGFDQISEQ